MQPLNIILFGKSGSGKGTQAKFLVDAYRLHYVSTGNLLRDFAKKDIPAAHRLRGVLASGDIAPSWLVFSLWIRDLENVREDNGILFDGTARRLPEALFLDEVLEWYGRTNFITFLIEISDDEAVRRLLARGRTDDSEESIRRRLSWFPREVVPVIAHYEKKGVLVRVNGEQSVEAVREEILSHLPSLRPSL